MANTITANAIDTIVTTAANNAAIISIEYTYDYEDIQNV